MRDGTRLVRVPAGGAPQAVNAPTLAGLGRAEVLRLSPDGVRAALVVDGPGGRASTWAPSSAQDGGVALRDLREVAPSLSQVVDVAWRDSGELLVLAGERGRGPDRPLPVGVDGWGLSDVPTSGPAQPAASIAAAPTRQPLVDAGGTIWQLTGGTWVTLVRGAEPLPGTGALLPALSRPQIRARRLPAGRRRDRLGGWAGRCSARSPISCCRARARAAGCPGRSCAARCAALLAAPAPGHAAAVPRGFPPTVAAGAYARAGSPGRDRLQGARPGRAGPARWGRRWRWPSPPSCRAVPEAAADGAAGAGAEFAARRCAPAGRDHVRELTGPGGRRAAGGGAARGAGPVAAPARAACADSAGLSAAASAGRTWRAPSPRCRRRRRRRGAAGPRRRRRDQRRDPHRGGRGAGRGRPPGRPAGARRRRRGDPATAGTRDCAERPARCPNRPEIVPDGPSSTVGTGGEGLASKRLQPVLPGGHMEIVVRGRNVEVPEHYRQHVEDKVGQLDRFDGKLKILRIDVELFHEKNPRQSANCQRVEITLRGKGPVVRAEAAGPDFYAALDLARGKLDNRLRRAADRRRVHHGRRTPASVRLTGNTAVERRRAAPWIWTRPAARRRSARDRPRRAPARPGRAGEAPPRHTHDRRPGSPRDGAGRPRLLPLPVRRHRPADGRLPPARLRLRPHPADRPPAERRRTRARRAHGRPHDAAAQA